MNQVPKIENSSTHRLAFFHNAGPGGKHLVVPHAVADEVEDLSEFVKFLFPQRGQDRFELKRPDILQPAWTVWDNENHCTFVVGMSPREAVKAARHRFLDSQRPVSEPFKLAS